MSFILNALKKSETDRQRHSGPSLFEVKVAPPRRALPIWAVAIAVLLGANVVVVSWMLLRRPAAQQPAAANSAPAAAPQAAASPPASSAAPAAAPERAGSGGSPAGGGEHRAMAATPETSPATAGGTAAGAASAGASTVATPMAASSASAAPGPMSSGTGSSPPSAAAAAPPAPGTDRGGQEGSQDVTPAEAADDAPAVQPAAGSSASGSAAQDLPLYQQIVASAGLPALHLDLHVFADRPQDRFVMINMHRLAEGDSLPNGVHVEAIRPDGAVLSYHGTRFLLPRN
jgi:general secretion pathway protein B